MHDLHDTQTVSSLCGCPSNHNIRSDTYTIVPTSNVGTSSNDVQKYNINYDGAIHGDNKIMTSVDGAIHTCQISNNDHLPLTGAKFVDVNMYDVTRIPLKNHEVLDYVDNDNTEGTINSKDSESVDTTRTSTGQNDNKVNNSENTIKNIPVLVTNRSPMPNIKKHNNKITHSNLITVFDMKWDFPSIMNCNARSVNNKIDELQCVSQSNGIDIVCITESWLVPDNMTISLSGYYPPFRRDREIRQGGGVMCFVKDNLKVKHWEELSNNDLETLWLTVYPAKLPRNISCIIIGIVYHPPNANHSTLYNHLSDSLDKILSVHPNAGIFLTGDFNKFKDNYVKQSYNLKQLVKEPTRGNNILDKIFTNMDQFYQNAKVLSPLGASDHSIVTSHPQVQKHYKAPTKFTVLKRSNDHNSKAVLVHAIKNINWNPLYAASLCEEKFSIFSNTLNDLLDAHLPVVEVKRCSNDKPWITDSFRAKVSQRQTAFNSGNKVEYNRLRNHVNRSSKQLKKRFYKNNVEDLKDSNPSEWWRKTKVLAGVKSNGNLCFLTNNVYNGDTKQLANDVNVFFQSVTKALQPLQPRTQPGNATDIPSDYTIKVEDVENAMCKINVKKSTGPDDLPNWIIRDLAPVLSKPVASIFNASLVEAKVPSLWKSAIIAPLAKTKVPQDIETDLRPISLTSILSKVLESFVVDWIYECVSEKLFNNQFGGIRNSSTAHALTKMLHDWHTAIHEDQSVRLLLLDYKKAFDLIDHNILLEKLKELNVPDFLVNWIGAFLCDRNICVRINNEISDWLKINGSVPQGSKLGPLLYVIMINDLQIYSDNFDLYKYMDDSSVSEFIPKDRVSKMQEAVDSVSVWSEKNNMQINPVKTVDMLISFHRSKLEVENLVINGTEIRRVDSTKLLGLIISNDLSWTLHVDEICKKANKRLFYLISLRRAGLSKADLTTYYIHIVRPVLEYCCVVWHTSLTVNQREKIENIQKRALKIIGDEASSLESLESRREQQCKKFFNDIKKENHKLHDLLPKLKTCNHYNTRNFKPYPLPNCTTDRFKNSFINYSLIHRQ